MFCVILILQVFGGSWGSTLALAYSQSHPDKVSPFSFLLFGIVSFFQPLSIRAENFILKDLHYEITELTTDNVSPDLFSGYWHCS